MGLNAADSKSLHRATYNVVKVRRREVNIPTYVVESITRCHQIRKPVALRQPVHARPMTIDGDVKRMAGQNG